MSSFPPYPRFAYASMPLRAEPLAPCRRGCNKTLCMAVLLVLIALAVSVLYARRACAGASERVVPIFVSSMKAALGLRKKPASSSAVDAHIGDSVSAGAQSMIKTTVTGEQGCYNLTFCGKGDPLCEDMKKIDPSVRAKTEAAVMSFLDKHPTCVVMIFAPWCPHCHTALPKFVEASKSATVPFALINAEMMDPKTMHGDKALFNVQYFPFIVKRTKAGGESQDILFKDVPSVENLLKLAGSDGLSYMFA